MLKLMRRNFFSIRITAVFISKFLRFLLIGLSKNRSNYYRKTDGVISKIRRKPSESNILEKFKPKSDGIGLFKIFIIINGPIPSDSVKLLLKNRRGRSIYHNNYAVCRRLRCNN